MRVRDLLGSALHNLRRQRLRSALTIFAVVIGATSVTIMLSLITGAKDFFLNQFESTGQLQQVLVSQATDLDYDHARFANSSNDSGVKLTDDLVQKIQGIPHVTAVARNASPWAFEALEYGSSKLSVQNVVATDANGIVVHEMLAGRDLTSADGTGTILLSQPYADKLGFAHRYQDLVGQKVTLLTKSGFTGEGAQIQPPQFAPDNRNNPGNTGDSGGSGNDKPGMTPPTRLSAVVLGVVAGEDTALYVPLSWARGLLQERRYDMTDADKQAYSEAQRKKRPGAAPPQPHVTLITQSELDQRGYNSLTVKVDETSHVDQVAAQIRTLGVGAATARSFVDKQLQIFNVVSLVLGGIGAIALAVAAIGVINTMVMAILERTREIGVLRACGATRATIRRLFMLEAGLLGFFGGVFGVAAGFGLTRVANTFINKQLTASSMKAHDIIGVPVWLATAVITTTTLIGVVAGLYPAIRASRLNPVEALRHE